MVIPEQRGKVLALPREADPFQVAALSLCLLYGTLASAFYDELSATSVRLYPGIGGRVFLAGLILGSLTALAGIRIKNLRGMRLERSGLLLLVTLCGLYTVWTPFSVGWRGLGLILWMGILVSVPGYVVARRRGRQIKAAERVLRGRPEVAPDGND